MELVVIADRGDLVRRCRYCYAEIERIVGWSTNVPVPEIKSPHDPNTQNNER
jgi:hypothetical protein